MKAKLIDLNGNEKTSIELSDLIFNIEPNEGVIHRAIQNELANRRQGTVCTKDRGEVSGSTKKPWRQKGTGRARAGSVKSPIWRGGGTVFGPKQRDYSYSIPKKMKWLSIRSIFSKRNQESCVRIIEDDTLKSGKTKDVANILYNISLAKNNFNELKNNKLRKKLRNYNLTIITDENDRTFRQSCRNLPWVNCLSYNRLSSYNLFYSNEIIMEKKILKKLEDLYLSKPGLKK